MEKTIENLRKNGFTVTEFDTRQAAADYLVDSLHGKTIGMGGSIIGYGSLGIVAVVIIALSLVIVIRKKKD